MPISKRLLQFLAVVMVLVGCDRSQGPQEGYCGPMVEEQRLRAMFDSIASLDISSLVFAARSVTDSALSKMANVNVRMSPNTISDLHEAERNGRLPRTTYLAIVAHDPDTAAFAGTGLGDSVKVVVHQLGDSRETWPYLALEVLDLSGWGASELYIFHNDKLIAVSGIFHRYGLQLDCFTTSGNKRVLSHNEVFSVGSGLSQSNKLFYELRNDSVVPLNNVLSSAGNVGGFGGRRWWDIWSRVEGADPMRITYFMENMWSGADTTLPFAIDSVGLDVDLDNHHENQTDHVSVTGARIWSYQAMERIPSTTGSFDHLFIATHKAQLERELNSSDTIRRHAMLDWLNCVRLGRP
jgi:hypothetical protein